MKQDPKDWLKKSKVRTSPGTLIAANLDTLQKSTQQCRTL